MYADALPNGVDCRTTAQSDVPVLKLGARAWGMITCPPPWRLLSRKEAATV